MRKVLTLPVQDRAGNCVPGKHNGSATHMDLNARFFLVMDQGDGTLVPGTWGIGKNHTSYAAFSAGFKNLRVPMRKEHNGKFCWSANSGMLCRDEEEEFTDIYSPSTYLRD